MLSNVEQCRAMSSNVEKRERERERLKTLPYTIIFRYLSKNLKMSLKDDILASTQCFKRFGVSRTKMLTETVEKGRERERLKTLPYTINFQNVCSKTSKHYLKFHDKCSIYFIDRITTTEYRFIESITKKSQLY